MFMLNVVKCSKLVRSTSRPISHYKRRMLIECPAFLPFHKLDFSTRKMKPNHSSEAPAGGPEPEAVTVPVVAGCASDEEMNRKQLLEKLTGALFPNDYLMRMVKEKGGPLSAPRIQELLDDEGKVHKQFAEDSRLDFLLRMKNTLNEKFENSAQLHPHGMTDFDYKSIPEDRRPGLEKFKMKLRRENYVYMSMHPDIDAMISLFMQKVIKEQPTEPVKFAGEFFTFRSSSHGDFVRSVEEEKKRLKRYRNHITHPAPGKVSNASQPPLHIRRNSWRHYDPNRFEQVNQVKKLGLGPLALDFGVTPPPTPKSKIAKAEAEPVTEVPQPVEGPIKKFYCGCKDPGRLDHRKPKPLPQPEVPAKELENEPAKETVKRDKMIRRKLPSAPTPSEVGTSEEEAFSDEY